MRVCATVPVFRGGKVVVKSECDKRWHGKVNTGTLKCCRCVYASLTGGIYVHTQVRIPSPTKKNKLGPTPQSDNVNRPQRMREHLMTLVIPSVHIS